MNPSTTVTPDSNVADYLNRLTKSRFWGSITLKFEAGKLVHARREENIKPSELSGNPETQIGSRTNK